ncbi:MAG: hypothetical protein CO113_03550, partial [Elusimicrobia bacterium CG_4_9_14_3_um_filter_62_55]
GNFNREQLSPGTVHRKHESSSIAHEARNKTPLIRQNYGNMAGVPLAGELRASYPKRMEVTLECGGTVDPLAVPAGNRSFRCSRGCEHPVLDDHRALIAEAESHRASNAEITAVRKSRSRRKTALAWGGGLAGLAVVDFTFRHAAAQGAAFLPELGVVFVVVCFATGLVFAIRTRSREG